MRRDLFLVESAARIREVLAEKPKDGLDVATTLGIGYFRAEKLPQDTGIGVRVVPRLLRSHVYSKIGAGLVSPYSQEILYFGETSLSVSRWLLLGLQALPIPRDAALVLKKTDWPDLTVCRSLSDAVGALLRAVQTRTLDMRASQVVFLLDFDVFSDFLKGWLGALSFSRQDLIFEFVSWFIEEWLHPNTLLVCENAIDFADVINFARDVRLESPVSGELVFRF